MASGQLTISEALGWLKTLRDRLAELTRLRDANSRRETRHMGLGGDKAVEIKLEYDVKALDKQVAALHKEIRVLDDAIKHANATVTIAFVKNEDVLGELG